MCVGPSTSCRRQHWLMALRAGHLASIYLVLGHIIFFLLTALPWHHRPPRWTCAGVLLAGAGYSGDAASCPRPFALPGHFSAKADPWKPSLLSLSLSCQLLVWPLDPFTSHHDLNHDDRKRLRVWERGTSGY